MTRGFLLHPRHKTRDWALSNLSPDSVLTAIPGQNQDYLCHLVGVPPRIRFLRTSLLRSPSAHTLFSFGAPAPPAFPGPFPCSRAPQEPKHPESTLESANLCRRNETREREAPKWPRQSGMKRRETRGEPVAPRGRALTPAQHACPARPPAGMRGEASPGQAPALPGTGTGRAPRPRRRGPADGPPGRSCRRRPTGRALRPGPKPGSSSAAAAARAATKTPASQLRQGSGSSAPRGGAGTRRGWEARTATAPRRPRDLRRQPSSSNCARRPSDSARR